MWSVERQIWWGRVVLIIIVWIAVWVALLFGGNVDPDQYLVYDIKRANPDMSSDDIKQIMGLPRYGDCMMIEDDVVKPMRGRYLWIDKDRSAAAVMSIGSDGCVIGDLLFEGLEAKK